MSLHANVSESCNTICNRLAVRSPKQGLESRRQAQCNCLAKSVVLRDVHRQCRYIISVAYTERCTAFVHANSRPISTRAANQQDYRVRVQKNLVVCAPALNSMRVSTRARARTHRCETHYCVCVCVCVCVCGCVGVWVCVYFNLLSCSDRGRGTNAAQASVLVSRIPSTSSPVASRDTARFTLSLIPADPSMSRGGSDGGANSGTWAVSGRVTPNRVAPLPARRARQMFFVADYDAVCAIMTTSLSLSRSHGCSHFPLFLFLFTLHVSPPLPMYPGAFLSLVGFFISFPLSPSSFLPFFLFLSHPAIFSLSRHRRGQTLLLPQPTSSRTREDATKLDLFLAASFLWYVYP